MWWMSQVSFRYSLANVPTLISRLVMELVKGAQHLHGLGIVHRDIKPGNVLVINAGKPDCHAELADFGFARGEFIRSTYVVHL